MENNYSKIMDYLPNYQSNDISELLADAAYHYSLLAIDVARLEEFEHIDVLTALNGVCLIRDLSKVFSDISINVPNLENMIEFSGSSIELANRIDGLVEGYKKSAILTTRQTKEKTYEFDLEDAMCDICLLKDISAAIKIHNSGCEDNKQIRV